MMTSHGHEGPQPAAAPQSRRAQLHEERADIQNEGKNEKSDAMGVVGMFGMAIGCGALCLGIPLLLSGAITLGAVAGVVPWFLAIAAGLGIIGWSAWRLRKARAAQATDADCCAPRSRKARGP